jgi:peptidoglycan/xylan/chitin deacetylase (PgdA/CDA1 family)
VSDEDVLHIKHLYKYKNIIQFKNDLDFILKKFLPISLNDFLNYLKNDKQLPKKAFLLTFDDGLRETYEIISPILLAKGIPATFFICSEFIDNKKLAYDHKASLITDKLKKKNNLIHIKNAKNILKYYGYQLTNNESILNLKYQNELIINEIANSISLDFEKYLIEKKPYLTSDQINDMIENGFSIGAHSIDHPLYSSLSLEQQLHQTISSITFIRKKFNLKYGVFAFPHNCYGVSNEFFIQIKKTGLIDAFFGTDGIARNKDEYLFQRFSMEMPLPVQKIISFQFARYVYKNFN